MDPGRIVIQIRFKVVSCIEIHRKPKSYHLSSLNYFLRQILKYL